jgi:glutamate-5-semialdehyde dehydrogenase
MQDNEIKQKVFMQAASAKSASLKLASMSSSQKNNILRSISSALKKHSNDILFHNEIDIEASKAANLSKVLIDRLSFTKKRIEDTIKNIDSVISLDDPIGTLVENLKPSLPIDVKKVRVPLGVAAMIYEARPNVTIDAAVLCLKTGNSVILKGGSEALNTNRIIAKVVYGAAVDAGMPDGAIQFIDTADRMAIQELISLENYIDLIIPRGSEELIKFIKTHSLIPVLSHGKGLCHTYIDSSADIDTAVKVAFNAKCQRPAVCNAMETLLVHKDIAENFLPKICRLYKDAGVEIRGDENSLKIIPDLKPAVEEDWETEYHDLIISIKIVDSTQIAINHINKYGSHHSDAIIAKDEQSINLFKAEVDSSAVFVNTSTRLHDGTIFGLGCEIGISTQKLHARGAMGVKELTTTKYIVIGNGNIKE